RDVRAVIAWYTRQANSPGSMSPGVASGSASGSGSGSGSNSASGSASGSGVDREVGVVAGAGFVAPGFSPAFLVGRSGGPATAAPTRSGSTAAPTRLASTAAPARSGSTAAPAASGSAEALLARELSKSRMLLTCLAVSRRLRSSNGFGARDSSRSLTYLAISG